MKLLAQPISKALHPAYRVQNVERGKLERFKTELARLLEHLGHSAQESEEHLKNIVSDFLKGAFYREEHFVNTKDRQDLVIHNGRTAKDSVGLAVPEGERRESVQQKFNSVPYLNSSLFEQTELERRTLRVSSLTDRLRMPVLPHSVLRQNPDAPREMSTLAYLFAFLDAYDFSSDAKARIQAENRAVINASVLGLIFEKINGYRDGSFFTPGFITMYMCRETLRRAVLQKFKLHTLLS